jgi:hypothetical protein
MFFSYGEKKTPHRNLIKEELFLFPKFVSKHISFIKQLKSSSQHTRKILGWWM